MKLLASLVLCLSASSAIAQSFGPITTPEINKAYYFVGTSPYLTTIQSAATAACNAGAGAEIIVPPGVTPSDSPTAVTGCSAVKLIVQTTLPWACYASTGGAYSSTNCGTGSGGGVTGVSVNTANGFQGTSSGGSTPALTLNVDSSHVLPVNTGSSSLFLNEAGGYSTPSTSGVTAISIAAANGFQGTSSGGATPVLTMNVDSSHVLPVNTGVATEYLDQTGNYSVPPGSGTYSLGGTLSGSNIVAGAGADPAGGGSATISGLDGTHEVAVTMGTTPASGTLFTVTFTASRGHTSYCIAQAFDNGGSTLSQGTASATGYSEITAAPLVAGQTYSFHVSCP